MGIGKTGLANGVQLEKVLLLNFNPMGEGAVFWEMGAKKGKLAQRDKRA